MHLTGPFLLFRYVMYAIERRQEIKSSHPELSFPEVTKILGNEWSTLESEKKQVLLFCENTEHPTTQLHVY